MAKEKYIVEINSDKDVHWYDFDNPTHLHRVNGPAIEYADGDKTWWLNGKRHREDGPAVEYVKGDKSWYLNGKSLTEGS